MQRPRIVFDDTIAEYDDQGRRRVERGEGGRPTPHAVPDRRHRLHPQSFQPSVDSHYLDHLADDLNRSYATERSSMLGWPEKPPERGYSGV